MTDPYAPAAATDSLSTLIHAAAKVGKSTLCSTAPLPMCALDVEGSWRFINRAGFCVPETHRLGPGNCPCPPLRKVYWNPNRAEGPPRNDGTWDLCVVNVLDWQTLTNAYAWLARPDLHDFRTLAMDSITEGQRKLKTNLKGLEPLKIQDWGDLLVKMDKLIRDMRDLVLIPGSSLRLVAFVAETRLENGKWRPYMQGQISVSLPYWVDLVGYLYPSWENDAQGQPTTLVNRLWVGPSAQFETGERVQGALGNTDIRDPHLGRIMETLFGLPESNLEVQQ